MELDDFCRTLDQLGSAGVFFVNLSGGEPFAHPRIDTMILEAHERFRHVVVLTNGTLIRSSHEHTIAKIIARKGEFPMQISLDSMDTSVNQKTRSPASAILANIRRLSELGANIVVAMVLSRFNERTVLDTIRRLARHVKHFHVMGVQGVRALNGDDRGYALPRERLDQLWLGIRDLKDELDLYIETPADESDEDPGTACGAPCMAGFSQLVIDPDLRVRPCDRCVSTFIGDLRWQSLEEVWRGEHVGRVLGSPIVYCQRDDQAMSAPSAGSSCVSAVALHS